MSIDHTTGTTPFGFGATESHQLPPSDATTEAVEFRVIRPGAPVRRLRLTGNRYTFGSAEGCSIRLTDPALRPMHAVLIRDAHRILVRAYSVPLDINGNRTTESILHIGDVIRFGDYRFELLTAPGSQFARSEQPAIPHARSSAPQPPIDDALWQERLRREVAQWRARQGDNDSRESQYTQRESILRDRESELWNRSEQLRHREVDLISQESAVIHIREDYTSKQQEVSKLLEENIARQHEIDRRAEEYRILESEYRQYADQAKTQLEQSQQQADAATEAVRKMRDQFAALNEQLEEFSRQQKDLEEARNEAINAQIESEAKLQHAEQRVEEMTGQIDATRTQLDSTRGELDTVREELDNVRGELDTTRDELDSTRGDLDGKLGELESTRGQLDNAQGELDSTRSELDQSRQEIEQQRAISAEQAEANEKLQQQVVELQNRIDEASSESSQLRNQYENALASVRQLELLVDQTNSKGHADYTSWVTETEQLRKSVEQLSVDLARANAELSELREANEAVTRQLAETEQERDAAQSGIDARPTDEAVETLRQELDSANTRVQELQLDHEQAIQRLSEERRTDQRQVEQLLIDQRDEDRRAAEARLTEAVAERDALIAELKIAAAATASAEATDEAQDADSPDSSSTGFAASAIAGTAGVISSFVAPADPPAIEETDEPSLESRSNDTDEGWPTYGSESLSGQDLVSEIDSDIVDSIADHPDLLSDTGHDVDETDQQSSAWESATAELTSTEIESEVAGELDALPTITEEADDEPTGDGSLWRVESEQSVESAGHFGAWDGDTSAESDAELAAQDGEAQWQDESPEVSVSEMIDDIEQSVDEVIADSDRPEQTSDESNLTSAESEPVAGDWSEQPTAWNSPPSDDGSPAFADDSPACADESPAFADESIGLADDGDMDDSNAGDSIVEESFDSDHRTGNETTDDYRSYTESYYDDAASESSQNESTDETAYNSWSDSGSEADHDESELDQFATSEEADETSDHSLADMLIRDLEASEANEETDDEAEVETDENENTYVMSEFSEVEPQDNYEATQAWDHSHLNSDESSDDSTHTESFADDTIVSDDSYGTVDADTDTDDQPAALTEEADADSDGASDDSIEDYMNRLLQRVQGDDDDDASEMAETSTLTSSSLDVKDDEPTKEATEVPEPVDANAPLIPRSQAPERDHNLTAMRALANSSARSAVARSVRIQARNTQLKGMNKFLQVAVALSCAVACYFFLNMGPVVKIVAMLAILVIAGILAQEGFVLLADARRRMLIAEETAGDERSDFHEPVEGLEDGPEVDSEVTDATAGKDPSASAEASEDLFAETVGQRDADDDGESEESKPMGI